MNSQIMWSFCAISTLFIGCVTPSEKRQIKDDIARLQVQYTKMQNEVTSQTTDIKSSTNKRTASTNTRIERMHSELQRVKGEIDTVRRGVITGHLPGHREDDGPSIANKIALIIERLDRIEKSQSELFDIIEKAGKKSKKKKIDRPRLTSLKSIRTAFTEKRYMHIKQDAPKVLKKLRKGGSSRKEAQFLFAESLYKIGDIKAAALEFDAYLKSKPKNHLAHANLRLGDCFRHLGDSSTAKLYYDELVSQHGASKEAEIAKERLSKLKI